MILSFFILLTTLILLYYSADFLAQSAVVISKHHKISPGIIGVMIGLFTSFPEIMSMGTSAFKGFSNMVIGNVFGSNITNLTMAFALPVMIFYQKTNHNHYIGRNSMIWLILPIILLLIVGYDGQLSKKEGIFLILMTMVYFYTLKYSSKKDLTNQNLQATINQTPKWGKNILLTWCVGALSLLILQLNANWLIEACEVIMKSMGINEYIIGALVVGLGTSLPEIASAFTLVKKGHDDILLGSIISSNVFNVLLGLGIATAIEPIQITNQLWSRDILILISLVMLIFIYLKNFNKIISLSIKIIMMIIYIIYIYINI